MNFKYFISKQFGIFFILFAFGKQTKTNTKIYKQTQTNKNKHKHTQTYTTKLKKLKQLQNYHLLMSFISGLNNAAISRLKWTKSKLHHKEAQVCSFMFVLVFWVHSCLFFCFFNSTKLY